VTRRRAKLGARTGHLLGIPDMSKLTILAEFWDFLRYRKKYWLLPIVVTLLLLVGAILLASGTGAAVTPFIYTVF
jgi:hypothetical protein